VADLISHIEQAKHNEKCAVFLIDTAPKYRDWAITAAFYAAVHLVEACFTTQKAIGHTESAPDRGNQEKHSYRIKKIRHLAPDAYKSYKRLFDASYNVRYLNNSGSHGLTSAAQYYSEATVRKLVKEHLSVVRTELEKAFTPLSLK